MNKIVLNETKVAYADSNLPWEVGCKLRNLNFKASRPVSIDDAVEIMRLSLGLKRETECGYNEFAPSLLRKLPEGSTVTLGRAGSVCVYVHTDEHIDGGALMADECDQRPNGWRLWWD